MMNDIRPKFSELIVVEGIHDKQIVALAVDADIWVIGGDRIAHRFLDELERASRIRDVIIFTDPDGPGERIRHRIVSRIPHCKHAYLPKLKAISGNKVGIEHASRTVILEALQKVRSKSTLSTGTHSFTMEDLWQAGLVSGKSAGERRRAVGDILNIGYGNAKSFLQKLNVLGVSRDEWENALDELNDLCHIENKGVQYD